MAFIGAITAAVNFVFSGTSIAAAAIRFVGGTLISAALGKGPDGPRIADKRVQTASYGTMLPRLYGESVRVAGNVIDKTDLIERKRHRGGFGKRTTGNGYRFFGLGRTRYYTYSVDMQIAVAEGPLPVDALQRIWANGRVVFDANAPGAQLTEQTASRRRWTAFGNPTQQFAFGPGINEVRFYRGDTIQPVDDIAAGFHDNPSDVIPAYRNTAFVILQQFQLQDFGNGVPNFEFELKTGIDRLGDAVKAIASFADVEVYDLRLNETLHGYVVANASSAWDAISPLASVFNFDLVKKSTRFEAIPRGRYMRTILDETELAAVAYKSEPVDTKNISAVNPDSYPDIVTVTYIDPDRDFQTNTQQAFRNFGVSQNKVDVQIPITMTADEAAQAAQRALAEALAAGRGDKFTISEKYRWLEGGDLIGIRVGGNVEPFRLTNVTHSPNTVIAIESTNDDPLAYVSDVLGSSGTFEPATVVPAGDTTLQLIDSPPVGGDDDTGFYIALGEASVGWVGADIERSSDGGTSYDYEGSSSTAAMVGTCLTTLPTGPVDVWDRVSTVTVALLDTSNVPETASEDDVLVKGVNLAWIGNANGQGGEFVNFATVTAGGSPNHYVLSNLLRGRWGTEWARAAHGALERFVLFESDTYDRLDYGSPDWNISHPWKAVTINQADEFAAVITFTNTGEGKRPLAVTLLKGIRDGSSNTLIEWTRRTRGVAPPLGGGPTPLQEAVEAYSIDIYHSGAVVRTLTSSVPSVTYTSAMATADGNTPGAALRCDVYQISDVRGRGHVLAGTV